MTADNERLATIAMAIMLAKQARDLLRQANCPRAADYAAQALKSAEGAYRHASGGTMPIPEPAP